MEKQIDVVALGELLIDFTNNGASEQGNTLFEANPGGAPCNVLAMLNRFGHTTEFVGKVGNDMFGIQLKQVLEELSIGTRNLLMDANVRTTLAFVKTGKDGERDFSFYRNPGADMMLTEEELDVEILKQTRIFHFGTLSMTHEAVRKATKRALQLAKEANALISFDPNLREPLWNTLDEAEEQVRYGLSYCDILKISDNELLWLTEETDYAKGIKKLNEEFSIPLILLSMGREGSRAYYGDQMIEVPAFLQEHTIETTGAGDTFMGCCLHFILRYGLEHLTNDRIVEMLTVANAAASIITTKKGALRVMPTVEEVETFLSSHN